MEQMVESVVDRAVKHVREHWEQHRVPVLLSTLGVFEDGHLSRVAKGKGMRLKTFLQETAGERVMIVEHSERWMVVGVVPREDGTEGIANWDELLESVVGGSETLGHTRLHRSLWVALRKPLGAGMERYVRYQPTVSFQDIREGAGLEGGVPLRQSDIAGRDASVDDVYGKAMKWLKENNLDIDNFRDERVHEAQAKLPSNDLLGKLISALGPRDLEKITVSMDVVAKLRRLRG